MKKIIFAVVFFTLTSNSYAANLFGDGSPEITYMTGQNLQNSYKTIKENKYQSFNISGGSISNDYIHGSSSKIPNDTQAVNVNQLDIWGR